MSEFDEWQAYFEERQAIHDKPDYYAAAMMRAFYISQGNKVGPIKDFLLDFEPPVQKDDKQNTKSVWLSAVGLDPEKQ